MVPNLQLCNTSPISTCYVFCFQLPCLLFLLIAATTGVTCALGPVHNTHAVRKESAYATMIKVIIVIIITKIIIFILIVTIIKILIIKNKIPQLCTGYLQVYGQCKTNTSGAYFAGDDAKYNHHHPYSYHR